MVQAVIVQAGDPARNFSLKDQNDKTFDLYEQAKKRTLLSFHPLAWTEFCAAQMKSLEDNLDEFARQNCVPVGISVDSRPCKQAWTNSKRSSSSKSTRCTRYRISAKSCGSCRKLREREGL